MQFFILNKQEEIVATLDDSNVLSQEALPVISATNHSKINNVNELTLKVPANHEMVKAIEEDFTVVFQDVTGFKEFIIYRYEDEDASGVFKTLECLSAETELGKEYVLQEIKHVSKNPEFILQSILTGSRWSVGSVDASIYNKTLEKELLHTSKLDAIFTLANEFNAEVAFSFEVSNSKVVKRLVHLRKQLGSVNGKRFEVGKDVKSVKRTVDVTDLKTAIYPYGKVEKEDDSGSTSETEELLTIASVSWSKAKGDPVDKPLGQEWLGDPVALANWGTAETANPEQKRHKFTIVNFDITDPKQLLSMSWVELGKYTAPKVTYELDVIDLYTLTGDEDYRHEHVVLGDTVAVIDRYFAVPVEIQSRVIEIERNLLNPLDNKIVLGHNKASYTSNNIAQSESVNDKLSSIDKKAETAIQSADGKNSVYYGGSEPESPNVGDQWRRPHPEKPDEQQLLIWDGSQWELVLDTSKLTEFSDDISRLDEESVKQQAEINTAVNTANNAVTEAGFSKDTANQAKQQAQDSFEKAQNALTQSQNANTIAGNANTAANDAKNIANSAKQSADRTFNELAVVKDDAGKALSNAKDALDAYKNMKLGVRNLLPDTQIFSNRKNDGTSWRAWNGAKGSYTDYQGLTAIRATKSTTVQQGLASPVGLNLEKGKEYTLKFKARGTLATTLSVYVICKTTPNWRFFVINQNDLSEEFKEYAVTFIYPATVNESNYLTFLDASVSPAGTWIEILGESVILVEGNKIAVDWQPAPEDFDNSLQVAVTNINGELSQKVSQNDYNVLKGTVTSQGTAITQNKTDIALKADKTAVDTLKGTVDKQGTAITQNANEIKQKASQSTVDTLTGRVSSAESQLTIQAGQIATKVTKADVDTQINSKGFATQSEVKQTADKINSTISKVETDLDNKIGNLLNNTTLTGTLDRWSKNPTHSVKEADFQGKTVPVQSIKSAGSNMITSDKVEVDSAKAYEVSIWLKSLQNTKGSDYFGLYAYDEKGTMIGLITVNNAGVISNANNTNPYFTSTNMPTEHLDWKKWTGYIMPSGTDSKVLKGKGTNGNYIMLPNTAYIAIRWLNYYNEAEREVLVANPKMIEISSDTLVQISQIEQTIDGIKTTVATKADASQVNQLADRVTTTVTKLDTVSNDLLASQAKGKNLKANSRHLSNLNKYPPTATTTVSNNGEWRRFTLPLGGAGEILQGDLILVETGKTYTQSLQFRTDCTNPQFNFNWFRTVGGHFGVKATIKKLNNDTFLAYSTYKADTKVNIRSVDLSGFNFPNGTYIEFAYHMFEEGAEPSQWEEKLEDIVTQGDITKQQTQIDQTADAIKLKADSSTVNAIAGRVTTAESQLTVQAKEIASKVTETQVNNLVNGKGFATQTWTNSQITQTANSIKQTVSSVEQKLDSLNVGSRNLLLKSTVNTTSDKYGFNSLLLSKKLEVGKEYTLTVRGSTNNKDNPSKYLRAILYTTDWSFSASVEIHDGIEVTKQQTFVTPEKVKDKDWRLTFYHFPSGLTGGNSTVNWATLVEGNKASLDWTPAPEDIKNETDVHFSTIEQTIKGIQSTVANKAEQSQVTQLAGQLTSVIKQVDVESPNLIKNGSFQDGFNHWTAQTVIVKIQNDGCRIEGSGRIYATSFSHEKGKKYKLKFTARSSPNTIIQVGQAGSTVDVALSGSNKKVEVEYDTVNANALSIYTTGVVVVTDIILTESAANQSQITQLSDQINLRVEKGKIINQINVSSEGILIAGNKIHIQGTTKIDNAVITSAMIKDVVADKITAGTLNAAKVNIINLNASNIVTGTLSANLIKVGFNNISNAVIMDQSGLTIGGELQKIKMDSAGMKVINGFSETVGSVGVAYRNADSKVNGTMIASEFNHLLALGKKTSATSTGFDPFIEIPTNKDRVEMIYPLHVNDIYFNDKESYGMYINGANQLSIIAEYAVSIAHMVGTEIKPVIDFQAGKMTAWTNLDMMYSSINNVNKVSANTVQLGNSAAKVWGNSSQGALLDYNNGKGQVQCTDGGVSIYGGLKVFNGSKNAAITVRDGTRLMYAYETAEYYHGDLGEVRTVNKEYKVNIETLFSDTIDLSKPYHVFLQSYSDAHVWVEERTATYFIVKSDKETNFSWEIKAKRRGYADERMKMTDATFKEAIEGIKPEPVRKVMTARAVNSTDRDFSKLEKVKEPAYNM